MGTVDHFRCKERLQMHLSRGGLAPLSFELTSLSAGSVHAGTRQYAKSYYCYVTLSSFRNAIGFGAHPEQVRVKSPWNTLPFQMAP